jgi:hypothetical protein
MERKEFIAFNILLVSEVELRERRYLMNFNHIIYKYSTVRRTTVDVVKKQRLRLFI